MGATQAPSTILIRYTSPSIEFEETPMDTEMTAKVAELKKHLEGIAGNKIDLSAEQLVAAVPLPPPHT
jgi:hypothetical protein